MYRENTFRIRIGLKFIHFVYLHIFGLLLFQTRISTGNELPLKQALENMFATYDQEIRPYHGGKPVEVEVEFFLLSVQEMNDQNQDFTVTMYLRQRWEDPRLSFRAQRGINLDGSKKTIQLGEDRIKLLWVPDTFVSNEKKASAHTATALNEFVKVNSSGSILKSTRYTMTLDCPMSFIYFPFDKKRCPIELESFSATMDDIVYHMNGTGSGLNAGDSVLFKLVGQYFRKSEIVLSKGNHSLIAMDLYFERKLRYYILWCFTPLGTAVMLSLLSLLFASQAVASLIHAVNISFVISYSGQAWILHLPKISYITSMDLYYFICLGHLLLCLCLSLALSFCQKISQGDQGKSVDRDTYRGIHSRRKSSCKAATRVCCYLKWIVVILFIISNAMYGLFYIYLTDLVQRLYKQNSV